MAHRLASLDPRNSLSARLGWAHVLISLLAAVLASIWMSTSSRQRIEENSGQAFQQYATQISNEIDVQLDARLTWIATLADALASVPEADRPALLARERERLPEFDWLALATADGELADATGRFDRTPPIARRAWFRNGLAAPWIDDLNAQATSQAAGQPPPAGGAPGVPGVPGAPGAAASPEALQLAAPLVDARGRVVGVLGAQLGGTWVERFGADLIGSLRIRHQVQVLVLNEAGVVLFGPSPMLGRPIAGQPSPAIRQAAETLRRERADTQNRRHGAPAGHAIERWGDEVPHLAGWSLSDGYGRFAGNGWTVWVREPAEQAFAFARSQQIRTLLSLLAAGAAIIVAGLLTTRRLTRELADIARSADQIRAGERTALAVVPGRDEAARIGRSLQALLSDLQQRSLALERLNGELDARVAARTREVERLADENRHAALVRERLRLARDLHDTLAQSLMSLLAEIRLMRKLVRHDPAALADELAHAEQAAQHGLREARAAIGQLRQHPVREVGLGPALEQLAWRTGERSGIEVALRLDPSLAALADGRAETVYRIAEEALRNVLRHAHAQRVEVALARDGAGDAGRLRLTLADDGTGFAVRSFVGDGHFGLQGMREQAELLGGTLQIDSRPGEGTRITLSMPL
ncbi:MAG: histidine kinase [Burkholderiaceae bacterium]